MALCFLVGLLTAHGCVDDRARVKAAVFLCNPASPTANIDCGAGFTCYSAAQSLGTSICVPTCNPDNPKSCDGACTQAGACLARCTVPDPGQPNPCPPPLLCKRITDSPLEHARGPDGVCLPVNQICSSSADCTSAIFDGCTSEVTGATQGPGLLTSGEVCLESRCAENHTACEPGSECIKAVLPASIPIPDVCSPLCSSIRDRKPGSIAFNECAPGLTCLSDAFPQTKASACAPGFPGWICVDQVGCAVGACNDWSDVDPAMTAFLTCTPHCNTDADCVAFDRGTNPNHITHFTCVTAADDGQKWCRNLSSLFFPLTCLRGGDSCRLDSAATCVASPSPPDGGAPSCGGMLNNGAMGLGAFGGNAASCQHGCKVRKDCDDLATAAHVPMSCQPSVPTDGGVCAPIVPWVSTCVDDSDCMGGLHCLDTGGDGGAPFKTCTLSCNTASDCAANNALGTNFACDNHVCTRKLPSGCKGGSAQNCLSDVVDSTGICRSPSGWACNADEQCMSGHCNLFPDTAPKFGRCM
jgi:hypothetical protein